MNSLRRVVINLVSIGVAIKYIYVCLGGLAVWPLIQLMTQNDCPNVLSAAAIFQWIGRDTDGRSKRIGGWPTTTNRNQEYYKNIYKYIYLLIYTSIFIYIYTCVGVGV